MCNYFEFGKKFWIRYFLALVTIFLGGEEMFGQFQ